VAKEAEDAAAAPKCGKNPPGLTFAREGGEETRSPHPAHFASNEDGGGGQHQQNARKDHLRLAFEREGGGGGGNLSLTCFCTRGRWKTQKRRQSDSGRCPACLCMRGTSAGCMKGWCMS
jgi:hypothetical protein